MTAATLLEAWAEEYARRARKLDRLGRKPRARAMRICAGALFGFLDDRIGTGPVGDFDNVGTGL